MVYTSNVLQTLLEDDSIKLFQERNKGNYT